MFGIDIGWIIGAVVVFVLGIFGVGKVRSDGKKDGAQQERAKQVETARKETAVAIDTKSRVEAQPKSEVAKKFSTYVRKGNGK